jgi:hypothetical protein
VSLQVSAQGAGALHIPFLLNEHNFSPWCRILLGPDKNAYYHEKFLRGKGFLAAQIPRTKSKGTGPRRPGSAIENPNFYNMRFLPPGDGSKSSRELPHSQHNLPQPAPTSLISGLESGLLSGLGNGSLDASALLNLHGLGVPAPPAVQNQPSLQQLAFMLRQQQGIPSLSLGSSLMNAPLANVPDSVIDAAWHQRQGDLLRNQPSSLSPLNLLNQLQADTTMATRLRAQEEALSATFPVNQVLAQRVENETVTDRQALLQALLNGRL